MLFDEFTSLSKAGAIYEAHTDPFLEMFSLKV